MHARTVLLILIFCAGSLLAQDKTPPDQPKPAQQPREAAIIPVKTLSGDSFNRMAHMLMVFGVPYQAEERLRTIVVYAPSDVVAQMRRVVEQLDQPGSEAAIGRNIDMTISFLRSWTTGKGEGGPLPAELEAVAKQLRAATQYKHIELWDVVPLRVQEGKETNHRFRLPDVSPAAAGMSQASLKLLPEAVIRKDNGRYVRFSKVAISFKVPYTVGPPDRQQFQFMDAGLDTAGEFKEGQKTVLGKISGIDAESAVFVVISLKVLD